MILPGKNLLLRMVRRVFACLPAHLGLARCSWRWLRYYPPIQPTAAELKLLNSSEWPEYQCWIDAHSLQTSAQWLDLRRQSVQWRNPPKISIVTPVFNTDPEELYQCLISVRSQAYPFWQWVLVNDASTRKETLAMLASPVVSDPRIKVCHCAQGGGIVKATNVALKQVRGDYVLFFDHDDRLASEALFYIAAEIEQHPGVDIVYSDRDMISPKGKRYMHLFKPDWSPETLLSGNYIFHPMCYRRELLQQLGGLSEQHEGSQDYDLILRAAETNPKVRHIPKVLYHWRQSRQSVAFNAEAKNYAFAAGLKALNDALRRRNINGSAREISELWRGNYQLALKSVALDDLAVVSVDSAQPEQYAARVSTAANASDDKAYLVVISNAIEPMADNALERLVAWLQFNKVGMVSGKIIDREGRIVYAGAIYKKDGTLLLPYAGYPESEPGYMAVTQIARNISAPSPYCVAINLSMWRQLEGLSRRFNGPHALLDLALRGLVANWRCVIDPQFKFQLKGSEFPIDYSGLESEHFKQTWRFWLEQGDPYYNANLTQKLPDMGISLNENAMNIDVRAVN